MTDSVLCKHRSLDLAQPTIMGVLNVTPDSFSDGGLYIDPQLAVVRAREMLDEGAAIIDVGGESTRPGASPVSETEELERVLPVIGALHESIDCIISIDTSKPGVMRKACEAGASLINDVRALREPGALEAAQATGAAVCLMHMQGTPATMQSAPRYEDVVQEVRDFLAERVAACTQAGIDRDRLIIDPGFGFGKLLRHNLRLLRELETFAQMQLPVLAGISRKSMFRDLLGERCTQQRLAGSLAAAVMAVANGASIIRAHDVAQTRDAIAVAAAVRQDI